MANRDLIREFRALDVLPEDVDIGEALDEILTEPQQTTLLNALAADAVDAAPILGDLLTLRRLRLAQERGVEYPARPAALENALSDLPPPLDTIADVLVSQHTLSYLERERGLNIPAVFEE